MFKKVLVANRGEIATRVIRGLAALEIESVAVFSEADATSLHVELADQAIPIGPSKASESYLKQEAILDAAAQSGAEAIHPGYGFLSENADFARAVAAAGMVFIGPSPRVIEEMGDKAKARGLAREASVPVVPGSPGPVTLEEAKQYAAEMGYPVLLKAVAGGGGIGMASAHDETELQKAFEASKRRAGSAFLTDALYLEKLFQRPRHIEVQILSDSHGQHRHLFERECSIQRRHQKVIEESPSPLFAEGANAELALAMREAAVKLAARVDYEGAGTVEFLVEDGGFHFIEMNTRLQVEHPCTELCCGLDLVEWQLRIAAGERISFEQSELRQQGHAIEFRLYAEDPAKKFFPSPGPLNRFQMPTGEGVRVDAGFREGDRVTPFYDPLLAKIIVSGQDRAQAIQRAHEALRKTEVLGIKTNLPALQAILSTEAFALGQISTHFIEEHYRPSER